MSRDSKYEPKLFILAAPSGAGKTTLCELLLKDFSNTALSISCTTRSKRPNEVEGVHYFFLSKEEFDQKIKSEEFAEWAEVHGNRYGTLKKSLQLFFQEGKNVLFDIDVQGAMNLRKTYGERAVLIFIHPPSLEELEKRLRNRKGDSLEAIEKRLKNSLSEIEKSKVFDYHIVNDDLSDAYGKLRDLVKNKMDEEK